MKLVTSLTLVAALLVAAPAAYAGPCDTEAANISYLCNAWRPMPGIQATPTAPRTGSQVVLETSATSRGSTLAWDLDGDGAFDDATGAKVTRTFNAGTPLVGVRETDQFGRTGSATLTLATHTFNARPSGTVTFSTPSARTGHAVTVTGEGDDPDGQIASVDLDLDGDGVYETPGAQHDVTFATPGVQKKIGARFTDDAGGTATATATLGVHAENLAPRLQLQLAQANGSYTIGAPLVAGDAVVTAYGNDADGTIAGFDFDLDGNGSYETHADPGTSVPNGIPGVTRTSFAAGVHEIGVRVSDADGGTAVARQSVLAVPEWPITGAHEPPVVPMYAGVVARTGVPVKLLAGQLEGGASLTWDADDDGQFDDGTGASPQLTFPQAGDHTVRVKAGNAVAWATVSVRDAPALPPVLNVDMPDAVRAGRAVAFGASASAADGVSGAVELSFDLNGDSIFDDVPSGQFGYTWTFPGPATIAVKATDGAQSAIRTFEVATLDGNLGPGALWNPMPLGFPGPAAFGQPPFLAGRATVLDGYGSDPDGGFACCTYRWDEDGDGTYGDPAGTVAQHVFTAGEHSAGLRITDDDGAASEMQRTFTVGTHAPKASFSVSGSTVTSTATDEDGDALSIEWDLDGDRAFDDASGPSARALEGEHLVGVKAADPSGEIGITYANVTGDALPPQTQPQPRDDGPIWRIATQPLELTVVAGRTPKLASVLKSGLSVTVRCSASCRTTVVASVDKKTAKKLHLRSRNIGRGTGFGGAVKVKLTAEAKRALKRVKSVKATLTMTAVGSDGLGAAASRTLTLKR
jgi:hypothetical protein